MKFHIRFSIFFISIFFSISTLANNIHGVLMVVKGDVEIQQKDKVTKAKVGLKVVPGDTIVTRKDSRAKLVMIDKNIINISPDSRFVLEKYEYNPEENKKGALLNVIYGKVRTTVNQKYDGDQNKFQVKTKSSVAGVRGTDFLVSFNQVTNASKVVTFEGKVEVGAGLDKFGKIISPVFVEPGQFTVANLGTPPSQPATVSATEMASLNEQTVADSPKNNDNDPGKPEDKEKKERVPSNKDPRKEDARDPSSVSPPPPQGSVLNEMGEDVSAPVVSDQALPPPPSLVPMTDLTSLQPAPIPTVDPSLIGGKSNVLINLTPSP